MFTSAATNDSFMLKPSTLSKGDIMAMDRAYIDYEKFEQMTRRGVIYVTKMKKNLKFSILSDTMYQTPNGLIEVRIQQVTFTKQLKNGETLAHQARVIMYADEKKHKLISLLTNDMESDPSEIIAIYHKRWEIELLFYDKYIVMISRGRNISDNHHIIDSLLRSTLHNDNQYFSPLSQSRKSLLRSHALSEA